jgi:hypothetical protein
MCFVQYFNKCARVGAKDECGKHARRKDKDNVTICQICPPCFRTVIYRKLSVCSITLCNHKGETDFELLSERNKSRWIMGTKGRRKENFSIKKLQKLGREIVRFVSNNIAS